MMSQQYKGFKSLEHDFFGGDSCFESLGPKSSQLVIIFFVCFKFVELFIDCEQTFLEIYCSINLLL